MEKINPEYERKILCSQNASIENMKPEITANSIRFE
jgi:hypothetical protein